MGQYGRPPQALAGLLVFQGSTASWHLLTPLTTVCWASHVMKQSAVIRLRRAASLEFKLDPHTSVRCNFCCLPRRFTADLRPLFPWRRCNDVITLGHTQFQQPPVRVGRNSPCLDRIPRLRRFGTHAVSLRSDVQRCDQRRSYPFRSCSERWQRK